MGIYVKSLQHYVIVELYFRIEHFFFAFIYNNLWYMYQNKCQIASVDHWTSEPDGVVLYDYTIVHIYICVVSEFICLKFDENKTVLDSHFPELKAVRLIQVSSIHVVQMICLKIFIYEIELKMENVSSDNNINPNSRKQPKATNGSSTHWENTTPRGIFSWPQDNNVY